MRITSTLVVRLLFTLAAVVAAFFLWNAPAGENDKWIAAVMIGCTIGALFPYPWPDE